MHSGELGNTPNIKGAKGNNSLKNECSTEILVTITSVMIVTGRLCHIIWSRK
jgi:hypothetical protein